MGAFDGCDEERLLTGARQFDLAALSQIHDCFYKLIYRYARHRTGDDQAAEDTAGEVFVRLLDALEKGKAPRQSLRGWLFGTAGHIVNDHFRRHYRVQNEDLEAHATLPASDEANPEHQLQLNLTEERLRTALTRLTPEQQHVVTLRFGQGLSHREVAELVGKSEGAVKLLQFRAMQALRRLLEPSVV
jgi:RNA polymerase sigma-70 factor (ECF subfamily)